jgi:glucose-1-phosphate adenylyltransferase
MELLDGVFDIRDQNFKIYARNYAKPASFIAKESSIKKSFVAEGCSIKGKLYHSVISTGCTVEEGVEIYDSVIMPGAVIKKGSVIKYSIVGEDAIVNKNCRIGDDPVYYECDEWGISVIGKGKNIPKNSTVKINQIV